MGKYGNWFVKDTWPHMFCRTLVQIFVFRLQCPTAALSHPPISLFLSFSAAIVIAVFLFSFQPLTIDTLHTLSCTFLSISLYAANISWKWKKNRFSAAKCSITTLHCFRQNHLPYFSTLFALLNGWCMRGQHFCFPRISAHFRIVCCTFVLFWLE